MINGIKGKYIYRVSDMINYLTIWYGKPQVSVFGSEAKQKEAVAGKKGIICFTGTTRHFDLWNGTKSKNGVYFGDTQKVLLWEASE